MGYETNSDSRASGDGPSLLATFKTGMGTVLILAGVSLGFYVASTVFGLIKGEAPPRLVTQLTGELVRGEVELPDNKGPVKFEVSPNILQTGLYMLTFLLLTIPTSLAGSMMKAGVGLLDSESVRVMKQLLEKLRRTS